MTEIIDREFQFENKDAARRFFQQLRQSFVNWNSAAFESEDFKRGEQDLRHKIK